MTRWFRAYDDAINDPKLLRLSDQMFRAWFTLLCVASKNDGVLPSAEDIALTLREKPAKVAGWITKLTVSGLLDNNDGVFSPHNWSTRQFRSDRDETAAQRSKRYRDKRNASHTVTRDGITSVTRDASVASHPPEAEAETDTKQSRTEAPAAVDEDLKRRAAALGAGVSAHFASRNLPVPNLDRCQHWLSQGFAQGTVLTAVETVLKRGKAISTLEYFDGAIADQHNKTPTPALQVVSSKVVVVEGTLEHTCWNQYRREKGMRPLFICQQMLPGSEAIVMGALCESQFPPGYDEATGEKLPPKSDEAAA